MSWPYRLARPILNLLPAESAHDLTVFALRHGLVPGRPRVEHPSLRVALWGLDFPNPVGLAAGFDKNAEVPDAMLAQGFGFVEVGSITPRPQAGNPRPRVFRLRAEGAVINRLGFNNRGAVAAEAALRARTRRGIVGVNLGANFDSEDLIEDYIAGLRALGPLADYVTVNISSPNTPGLRALQDRRRLEDLIDRLEAARRSAHLDVAIVFKLAPDLVDDDLAEIAAVAGERAIDGLIVSNTTIARPDGLTGRHRAEAGGLSGRPLMARSTAMLRRVRRLTAGRVPLIGVGGVASGADAYAKIRAGASLVQLYTALIYEGPGLIERINRDLIALLARDGFGSVAEAVGADD